jgi:hypothetical protein
MSMLKREKSYTQSQAQQPQQQDSNIQQSNKNGTFVDYKTLKFYKNFNSVKYSTYYIDNYYKPFSANIFNGYFRIPGNFGYDTFNCCN